MQRTLTVAGFLAPGPSTQMIAQSKVVERSPPSHPTFARQAGIPVPAADLRRHCAATTTLHSAQTLNLNNIPQGTQSV